MHNKVKSAVVFLITTVLLLCVSSAAFAAGSDTTVIINGREIDFDIAPVVVDNVIMVEVRPLAEALGLDVKWSQNTQSVKLTNSRIGVVLKVGYDVMTVSDLTGNGDGDMNQIYLPAVPMAIDGAAFVPVRSVAEAVGAEVIWDSAESAVKLSRNGYIYRDLASPVIMPSSISSTGISNTGIPNAIGRNSGHTFYFQNQSDWNFPSYGSGYCWTVSYAMLISDVTGTTVTPVDVAKVNEASGGSGSYCYHWDIVDKFGVKFISALDESSPYYGGRDSNSGGTKIKCSSEYQAVQAIKEALDRNPAGVMVRYADYPHTMVAVGYQGDTIFFNEPMQVSRSYMETSPKENVTFDETCVGKRGIDIEDITFIQALAVK